MCSGSLFHSFGATAEKERSPYILNLVVGMSNNTWDSDVRGQSFLYGINISEVYFGARSFNVLKVSRMILHCII